MYVFNYNNNNFFLLISAVTLQKDSRVIAFQGSSKWQVNRMDRSSASSVHLFVIQMIVSVKCTVVKTTNHFLKKKHSNAYNQKRINSSSLASLKSAGKVVERMRYQQDVIVRLIVNVFVQNTHIMKIPLDIVGNAARV